tara:strand:- start:3984 stop:7394 length:3411 start_codon:yes stop_codon:yes gene_type:complete
MEKNDFHFTNFKIHSQYSICEGAVKIDELAQYCKSNKIKAIGLCDSLNLCGALEFAEKISKVGTQPILGSQINFKVENVIGKLPVFAKTKEGYKNLTKLSSESYLESEATSEPYCKLENLFKNSEGLVILSGTVYDFFGKLFKLNKLDSIKNLFKKFDKTFQNNFYIEIQRHLESEERNFEDFLISSSLELKLPLIASQEVFYIKKEMAEAHDALICVGEKSFVDDKNRKKFRDNHYLRSQIDLKNLFKDIPEALENNYNFPKKFSFKPKNTKPILPSLALSKNKTAEEELLTQAQLGLENRLQNFIFLKNKDKDLKKLKSLYNDRLKHEINIINSMNYPSYFLIVSDYIRWAKNNSIPVGPGRGSGAGSLVAYSLDITDLDPIEFDLIFERFLNPDRISMPDFDIDFCEEKRDKVFEYLKQKYGKGVAHIITFGKLKARMALRDIGRVLGLPYGHVDKICKMIPFDPSRPLTLQESINREPRFQNEINQNSKVKKLIELSLQLEGLNRNMATHAAGVVIAGKELSDQIPLYIDHSSKLPLPSTQYDMYSSENAGLVKFDLLGLKTLTVIDKTVKMINKKKIGLDISKINLKDKKVFDLLSTGETTGLFQLESTGMREAIKQMKPNKFDDIIALVALYRPGPMSNIPIYNDCKNGLKKPEYIHPSLESILKPTYGIIIYQEQVMQIAQTLAGFSAGEADILRRAMGKKKRAELEKQRERFVNGAVKNGIKKDLANYIFTKIEPFAEYGFNKSHAAAYALIAFQTAYLKTYYKEEFIASTMSTETTNTNKLREFVDELKRLKVDVIRPDINECFTDFRTFKNTILYGLGAIKNVGSEAVSNLIKERESNGKYKSLMDFIKRANPKDINKLQLEGLVKSGTFDKLEKNRKGIFDTIPKLIQLNKICYEEKISKQSNLFDDADDSKNEKFNLITEEKWTTKELLNEEFKSLGFYISDHPLNNYKNIFSQLNIKPYKEFIVDKKNEGLIAGTLMTIQEKKSSKGTPFAIAKFSDNFGDYELFIFSEILIKNREILKEGESFVITLFKDISGDQKRINVKKIISLDSLINNNYKKVSIEIDEKLDLQELKQLLEKKGETEVQLIIRQKDTKFTVKLENPRKFDLKLLNEVKNRDYVKKITF